MVRRKSWTYCERKQGTAVPFRSLLGKREMNYELLQEIQH